MFARAFPLTLGLLGLTSCVVEVHSGPTRHEFREFDRAGVERLRLDLQMGAGQFKVRGGAAQLARADFTYNVEQWKPEVTYHTFAGASDLNIAQPSGSHTHIGDTKYNWDIEVADDIPLDLNAHVGAGEAHMNLGSLNLRRVEVEMGVGQLDMDLRGAPKHDYDVHIHGGIGEATVHLPHDAEIIATGSGGIGEIHTQGLQKQGDRWTNDVRNAKARIHVDVEGGIGQINLIVD
jgi:hypothetical protein